MRFLNLPAADTLDGSEIVPVTQSGSDVQATTQGIADRYKGTKGANLASAATVTLASASGNVLHVTGTTTISSFGNADAGLLRTVIFDGALTLTHNATSLILPTGANITTAAGDTAVMFCDSTNNWRCLSYQRKDGTPLVAAASTPCDFMVAISDETTAITIGAGKLTFRATRAMTITKIKASLSTSSSSGNPAFDVNKNGVSVFSTTLTIDSGEKTSETAATAAVLSGGSLSIAADDEITIDIDTAGTGAKGAKIAFVGTY